jgi:L-threonylcarbamoyladenylate synthase
MIADIEKCYKVLLKGGLILYPTDTIWGIGCDATNAKTVDKVYEIKMRAETKSMIILLDDIIKLDLYVEKVPTIAYDLIDKYDVPLTIIYPKAKNLAKNVIAKDGSIAIRIVKDEFCKRLINLFSKPIISTSANISREETPLTFSKIPDSIKNNVDYIVKYGQNKPGLFKASTIIKISERGDFKTVRK